MPSTPHFTGTRELSQARRRESRRVATQTAVWTGEFYGRDRVLSAKHQ
jgi:hypothetical protein